MRILKGLIALTEGTRTEQRRTNGGQSYCPETKEKSGIQSQAIGERKNAGRRLAFLDYQMHY